MSDKVFPDKLPPPELKKKKARKPLSLRYKLPDTANELVQKIVDNYPIHYDRYTLRRLMNIGRIKYSESENMTACVINTKPYTLAFGVPFLEDNMETIEDCVYLLSHELTHLALDHFSEDILSLFEDQNLSRYAANIVLDCQVNATCHHSLVEEKYFEFLKRYYPKDQMPFCFFRADGEPPEQFKEAHEKLYSREGITNKELIDALMPWFEENRNKLKEIVEKFLLGNHEDLFKGRTVDSEELSDIAEHIVEQLEGQGGKSKDQDKKEDEEKDPEGRGKGDKSEKDQYEQGRQGGQASTPMEKMIESIKSKIAYARRIRQQLNEVWEKSPQAKIYKAIEGLAPKRRSRGVVPNFRDRKAAITYMAGTWPVFFKNKKIGNKVSVPCYLDVSGSQSHVLPVMLPVVIRLKEILGEEIFCFSNIISPCKITDLQSGKYTSTGGTDFNPVAKHILDNQYRCAVIFTDGEAGLNEDYIKQLRQRKINIKIGWTVSHPDLEPLKYICNEMFYVFDGGK